MEKSLGQFIKEKRIEKNLTQKELSEILYVSESAISKWEKDVARPDISLLPKLSSILGVSEHEIITASTDNEIKKVKAQAKKWNNLSKTWDLFFIISYLITIFTCFVCNLSVNKTLSWFFIVLFSLVLAFTFTNLPRYIKKYRIILIPLSEFIALSILLIYTEKYTNGDWAFISIFSTFVFFIIVFLPIILTQYIKNKKIKSFVAHISLFVDYILTVLLTLSICKYVRGDWFIGFAFPLASMVYATILIIVSVKFLKLNKLLKTSIILLLSDFFTAIYTLIIPDFVIKKFPNAEVGDRFELFKMNFLDWSTSEMITNNVMNIICLTVLATSIIFAVFGIIKKIKLIKSVEK